MWHGVSVLAGPASEPITVAKLKSWLHTDGIEEDALLGDLIKAAVGRIDGPAGIGVAMMEQTWRKSLDCFPRCEILLPGWPVKSVTTVTYVDVDGVEQTLAAENWRLDIDTEPARLTPAYGESWPSTRAVSGAVKVDYVLGEADAADVSPDLIDAVRLIVAHRYEHREAAGSSDVQVLPLGVEWILNNHRRSFVAA